MPDNRDMRRIASEVKHLRALDLAESEAPPEPEAWRDEALCAQADPELFFPEKGSDSAAAKAICAGCDVREQCLAYALRNNESVGVWGGMSSAERRRAVRQSQGDQPPMAKRDLAKRERDLAIVAMRQTRSTTEIADALGITQRTIHRVLAAHRARQEALDDRKRA